MAIEHQHTWAFAFGLMGNIISFFVILSPLPTFYEIYKKKTSKGFQSIPYVIALFSGMLWILYALVKKEGALLLITINTFCCVIETLYLVAYLFYAPKKARILTMKLILVFNVFGFGVICFITLFLTKGKKSMEVLGYICMAFALSVFAAPLGIVRKVIKTKSVEFMPFSLSFFLTLGAVMWFFYGLFLNDMNIAVPNVLGFIFGVLQMILYVVYKNAKQNIEETKLEELSEHIVDVMKLSTMVCSEINAVVPSLNIDHTIINGNEVIIQVQSLKNLEDINDKIKQHNKDGIIEA